MLGTILYILGIVAAVMLPVLLILHNMEKCRNYVRADSIRLFQVDAELQSQQPVLLTKELQSVHSGTVGLSS